MDTDSRNRGPWLFGLLVTESSSLDGWYLRAAELTNNGIELLEINDPVSARINALVRSVVALAQDSPTGLWDDVLGAAKRFRWRLMSQPQPLAYNTDLRVGAEDLTLEIDKLRPALGRTANQVLKELVEASAQAIQIDPAAGRVLLESVYEVGVDHCIVVAVDNRARLGLATWLAREDVEVKTLGGMLRSRIAVEQAYAVGPPRFFPSSLITAPLTESLSFVIPAWFKDRSIPRSVLGAYAEGATVVAGRTFSVGDSFDNNTESGLDEQDDSDEADPQLDSFLPHVTWPTARPPDAVRADEIPARKVLLSGGYSTLLDEGERIRAVDPGQPPGQRVLALDVSSVRPGVYLLMRTGTTEREALYHAAMKLLEGQTSDVEESQHHWKNLLRSSIDHLGVDFVVRSLSRVGVGPAYRARAWTDPMLARPRSDRDFEILLDWLGIERSPTFELATLFRRKRAQASADIAEKLESAVTSADMGLLEDVGNLRVVLTSDGFRGVIATKVLAVSPDSVPVSRYDVRILQEDRSAKWLE